MKPGLDLSLPGVCVFFSGPWGGSTSRWGVGWVDFPFPGRRHIRLRSAAGPGWPLWGPRCVPGTVLSALHQFTESSRQPCEAAAAVSPISCWEN